MTSVVQDISLLCRGEPTQLKGWLREGRSGIIFTIVCILICGGIYGFTLGILRSPVQAVYAAIKFPILIFGTVLVLRRFLWKIQLPGERTVRKSTPFTGLGCYQRDQCFVAARIVK